jgi:hypothetical protein
VSTFGRLALLGCQLKMVGDVNATNDQDLALELDVALGFRNKITFAGRDSARFQRAT